MIGILEIVVAGISLTMTGSLSIFAMLASSFGTAAFIRIVILALLLASGITMIAKRDSRGDAGNVAVIVVSLIGGVITLLRGVLVSGSILFVAFLTNIILSAVSIWDHWNEADDEEEEVDEDGNDII